MKILCLLLLLSNFAFSQGIEICEQNTTIDVSGTCITVIGNGTDNHTSYQLTLKIKSTFNNSKKLKVTRLKLIETIEFDEAMIWGLGVATGVTYSLNDDSPSNPWTSPHYFSFDSLTEGVLYLYTSGASNNYAKYRYYIQEYFPASDSTFTLDSVDVAFGTPLSINKENLANISVYPNPTADLINVDIENLSGTGSISIYDITGKVVSEAVIKNGKNQLNVSALNAGVYFYSIRNNKGVIETKKLLIQ